MATSIPDVSLIDNSDERLPIVLVLDCSGSMEGEAIDALNAGLKLLEETLRNDPAVATRGRLFTVAFGGRWFRKLKTHDWQDAVDWTAPVLKAHGTWTGTPTGAAVACALKAIEAEKAQLRAAGVSYKRPLMFLMSDGMATDDWAGVADACKAAESAKKVSVYPIAIRSSMYGKEDQLEAARILDRFSSKQVLRLKGLNFKELFVWLSQSVRAVSQSAAGETVQLTPPTGWAVMDKPA